MTTMLIKIRQGNDWVAAEVQTKPAFEMFGYSFLGHATWEASCLWTISEKTSGCSVVTQVRSYQEAVAQARSRLETAGEDAVKTAVRVARRRWPSRPRKGPGIVEGAH